MLSLRFTVEGSTVKLKTSDVPQADSLALVRRVLEALAASPSTAVKDLAERTSFPSVMFATNCKRLGLRAFAA
jgi:hypothetical protein